MVAPSEEREPLVELRGVSKRFGDKTILDSVDLTLYRGEALVIIGPSGTGKSTILRIIAGLLAPDSGEVYVRGERRHGLVDEHEDPISIRMVFQQAALFDSLSVAENIGFALFQHSQLATGEIREIVDERLEMVGLSPDVGDLYPAELSGGMRKRVSFARAIIRDPTESDRKPSLVLYDEPTAGLDPIASTIVEDLVRQLQCSVRGCGTYVMVSHQDSTIRRTADRVIFLYDGKVQWQDTVDRIDKTDNPMVRQFFSASVEGPIQIIGAQR